MKSLFLTLFACLSLSFAFAQAPQLIKYQTVVRNAQGEVVANQNVGLQLRVLIQNNEVYTETHDVVTNGFGLATVEMGANGDGFGQIDWSTGEAQVEVSMDITGGTDYEVMGVSDLRSVPYAIYANEAQSSATAEYALNAGHAETVTNADDADADPANEIQSLSINGSTLSISGGNSVELPEAGTSSQPEELAKAWVKVPIFGNPNLTFDAFNVTNVTHTTTGVYVITLPPGMFSVATNPAIIATVNNDLAPGFAIPTYSAAPSQVTVRTYDANGNLSDRGFSMIVHGK